MKREQPMAFHFSKTLGAGSDEAVRRTVGSLTEEGLGVDKIGAMLACNVVVQETPMSIIEATG